MKKSFTTGFTCYRELGQELERHGVDLLEVIRLAMDSLLEDLPCLRDLYHDHAKRRPPVSLRKLRRIERELADRIELLRAQRAARFLARLRDRIPPTSVLTERRKLLRAMREGDS